LTAGFTGKLLLDRGSSLQLLATAMGRQDRTTAARSGTRTWPPFAGAGRGTMLGRVGFPYVKPRRAGARGERSNRTEVVMSDRERDAKTGAKPKEQRQPVVGRDVPDESKERHTEIAVEAGHHDASKKSEKSR
jgi:hypothetical protein